MHPMLNISTVTYKISDSSILRKTLCEGWNTKEKKRQTDTHTWYGWWHRSTQLEATAISLPAVKSWTIMHLPMSHSSPTVNSSKTTEGSDIIIIREMKVQKRHTEAYSKIKTINLSFWADMTHLFEVTVSLTIVTVMFCLRPSGIS